VWEVASYGAVCGGFLAAGAGVAAYRPPTATVRSYIQHVAAGFVFAAVGVEVLPDVLSRGLPLAAAFGFALGVAAMLAIRIVAEKAGGDGAGAASWTFIGVLVVDIFVDGLLIGVSFVAERGQGRQALLVTVALSAELLALGLAMAATMARNEVARTRIFLAAALAAASPLLGATAGYFLGGRLSGGWIEGVLAFAAAALLYLATEELLKEAHEVPETPLGTTLFFAAFLAMLLIDMAATTGGG
jgi:ZIP family zinc transporter